MSGIRFSPAKCRQTHLPRAHLRLVPHVHQEGIAYLQTKYPPLRGELWYRREPVAGGAKTGKKFLDVFFLEETLPDLLDLLLGADGGEGVTGGGVGLTTDQVHPQFDFVPACLLLCCVRV